MRKDFALCFNDKYVPYACVTIKSIVDHMKECDDVYVHIFSDYISDANKRIINKIFNNVACCQYVIYDTSLYNDAFLNLPKQALVWTVYAWYRVLIPVLLKTEITKVLYLDCDVYVNDNLDDLFMMDIATSIAACLDTETYNKKTFERLGYESCFKYVSSGVLMINLDNWRKNNLSEKLIQFVKNYPNRLKYPDQDAINVICKEDKIILPSCYGVAVSFFRCADFIREHLSEMKELMENPKIIHYAGYQPWYYFKDKSMHSHLWWKTFRNIHAFPRVYITYVFYFIFYWIKRFLIWLGFIKSTSKYYMLGWYYNHPRIKAKDVYKLMESVS